LAFSFPDSTYFLGIDDADQKTWKAAMRIDFQGTDSEAADAFAALDPIELPGESIYILPFRP